MDKTAAVVLGVYVIIILGLVGVFVFEPQKLDLVNQSNPLEKFTPSSNVHGNLADLFAKTDDGVVQVIVHKIGENATDRAIGSGIVYDMSGHIITNNHVIDKYEKIRVVFHNEESYQAILVGADPYADLAVIKVNTDSKVLHPLPLGDSSKLRIGDEVLAIGSPFGLTGSLTSGIVSQTGRILNPPGNSAFSIPNVIQTDAAINPGNSGGPLLNDNGEVIGINTAIQTETGEFSGVGFSIPSSTMKKIVPVLIQDGNYKHPWLGISGITVDPDISSNLGLPVDNGFLVQRVVSNSPAYKAGIMASNQTKMIDGIKYKFGGDIITGADSSPVKKLEDLLNYLQDNKSVGDKLILKVIRNGKSLDIPLILQERPPA